MLKVLLLVMLLFQGQANVITEDIQKNVGIARNEHYIDFMNGEGYYIEESGLVATDDVVYITEEGDIYVIDHIEGIAEAETKDFN